MKEPLFEVNRHAGHTIAHAWFLQTGQVVIHQMSLIRSFAKKFYETIYKREWSGELAPHVSQLSIAEAYLNSIITR